MGSRKGHSSGRSAALRPGRRGFSTRKSQLEPAAPSVPNADWKGVVRIARDDLTIVKAMAAVVQRAMTSDEGDPNAAMALLEGVCYPLAGIISRLDSLTASPQS